MSVQDVVTRRKLLKSVGIAAIALPLLQACSGGASAPPAAPTSGTSGTATQGSSEKSATAAPKSQAAASGTPIPLSIAVWTIAGRDWQKHWAQEYQKQHAEVKLDIVEIPYPDMAKKQLAEIATGTLQDAVYSGIKWMLYSAAKGAFHPLDDFVKSKDPGMDDFFAAALTRCKLDGKLFALPFEVNTGNRNITMYNQDMLEAKGVTPPTDDWKIDDFVKLATQLTDKDKKIWGTDYFPGSYYDLDALVRGWGAELLGDDGKKFNFASDPKSVEAARWAVELRSKYHVAPLRTETESTAFPAGQIALSGVGIQSILSLSTTIGDKFKYGVVLGPTGPDGLRGYEAFVSMYSMSAKSKNPDQAFDLVTFETSKDVATWAFVQQGQPSARQSVWANPDVNKTEPVWGRALKWISNGKDQGPFPMPYNLRFSELEDKFENVAFPLFYGEVPFEDGLKKVQAECEKIVNLPRP